MSKNRNLTVVSTVIVFILAGIFCPLVPQSRCAEYLQFDARITGDEMHHFKDGAENISAVIGNFVLEVGQCRISGEKAVIWIKTMQGTRMSRHDITVYLEGNATVVEEQGVTTTDRMMLIKLRVQGTIKSEGGSVDTASIKNSPLYSRAVAVRKQEDRMVRARRRKVSAMGLREPDEPAVVVRPPEDERQPEKVEHRAVGPADTLPLDLTALASGRTEGRKGDVVGRDGHLSTLEPSAAEKKKARAVPLPPPVPSISFRTTDDGFKMSPDPDHPGRRIFISQGPTYLSQGTVDSDQFMEMEADSMVVFSRSGAEEKRATEGEERVPYAPRATGLGGSDEAVTGVYLDGSVRLRRGERRIRAERIYYDFTTDRALIIKPVVRLIQEKRNVPIIVRADEARQMSNREIEFSNATISTSDFRTPTYRVGARVATISDETPYDDEGERLGERRYRARYKDSKWFIRDVPVFYSPAGEATFEEGHSPLKTARIGDYKDFGTGIQTEWYLFRLLGLVEPEDFDAILTADYYEKGGVLGLEGDYHRSRKGDSQYCGYFRAVGVYDADGDDDFGDRRRHVDAQTERGRVLIRHKEFLPLDWQAQAEMSLISDRNFLEKYYRSEFWAGKEQENLIYAKKQRDNWAIQALLKARFNDFMTQTDAFPDLGAFLIGEPLWADRLTYFGEARVGAVRYREDDSNDVWMASTRSAMMGRFDTRHEIDLPLSINTPSGILNVVPYGVARLSYWTDEPDQADRQIMYNRMGYYGANMPSWMFQGRRMVRRPLGMMGPILMGGGENFRFHGEVGVRSNMNFWRIYDGVQNDLLDINRIKHVVTPELVMFGSTTGGVDPEDLYPISENVEQNIRENFGVAFNLRNLLQTKRGPEGEERTVDWMRFNVGLGFFSDEDPTLKGDGDLFVSRPEYSFQRSYLNLDYYWAISNSISLLADLRFDLEDGDVDTANIGVSVERDPRLSYYVGLRHINDLNSTVGTFGLDYKINKKYSVSLFEQYEFDYRGGVNLGSSIWIVRKLPRWYIGLSLTYDERYDSDDEFGILLVLWPEGIPESRPDMGRLNSLLSSSDRN
jgi:hypothetical protein